MTTELDRLRAENERARKLLDICMNEIDRLRAVNVRLRVALLEMQEAFVVDNNTTMTQFQQQATRMADAALAATPPAAEPAGHGDGLCPYCNGSGEDSAEARYAVEHAKGRSVSAWCGRCNGTGKQQEARP